MNLKTSQQSIFKPIQSGVATDSNSSLFTFESTQPKQRPTTMALLNECVGQQQNSSVERLTSLHARLHQEADKIRRWKTHTEIEIKQKNNKIVESSKTIDSLRKSMLELQKVKVQHLSAASISQERLLDAASNFHNENLSMKLQEEIDSRQEITQKIQSTREMCNILKDHAAQVDVRIQHCETEKTELKYLEKEHSKQFEEMTTKFKKMEIATEKQIQEMQNQLKCERVERESLDTAWKDKIEETDSQLQSLLSQCTQKDAKISEIMEELEETGRRLAETLEVLDRTNEKIQVRETEYSEQTVILRNALDDISHLRAAKSLLEVDLENGKHELTDVTTRKRDMEVEFDSWKQSHENTLLSLREEVNDANKTIDLEKQKFITLQEQFDQSQKCILDLTNAKDALIMDKSELDCELKELHQTLDSMTQEKDQAENELKARATECEEMAERVVHLGQDVQACEDREEALRRQVEKLEAIEKVNKTALGALNTEIHATKTLLTDVQKLYESSLSDVAEVKEKLGQSETSVDKLTVQCQMLSQTVERLERDKVNLEVRVAEKEDAVAVLEARVSVCNDSVQQSQYRLDLVTQERDNLLKKVSDLEDDARRNKEQAAMILEEKQTHAQNMQGELDAQNRSTKALENKTKTLKSNLSSKCKEINNLEKEIKSLRTNVDKLMKEKETLSRHVEDMGVELGETRRQQGEASDEVARIRAMCEEYKTQVDSLKATATKMEKRAASAAREKQEAVSKCDAEMREMTATLENYKKENLKIVEQKVREVEHLRGEVERLEQTADKAKRDEEELKEKYEASMSDLQDKCHAITEELQVEKEKQTLQSSTNERDVSINTYKSTIDAKDQEIVALRGDLKALTNQLQQAQHTEAPFVMPSTSSTPQAKVASIKATSIGKSPAIPQTPQRGIIKLGQDSVGGGALLVTPQRSILKQSTEMVGKKRRVSFQPDSSKLDSDDETSGSECMEVELYEDILTKTSITKPPTTPIMAVKPSPNTRMSRILPTTQPAIKKTPPTPTLKPVPRGPPLSVRTKKDSPASKTMDSKPPQVTPRSPEQCGGNVRQTPAKAIPASKILKYMPADRKANQNKATSLKKQHMDWFELDAVFGFGSED